MMTPQVIARAMLLAFGAFLVAVPWLIPVLLNKFWVSVIAEIMIWALFAASVNLLFGYVGLLSFGQALYFGFGMYGVAIGVATLGLSFWPAFGLGIAASVAIALVSGIFAVRLTWHYFAIITVVFSLIFHFFAVSVKPVTGGDDGIMAPRLQTKGKRNVRVKVAQRADRRQDDAPLADGSVLGAHRTHASITIPQLN